MFAEAVAVQFRRYASAQQGVVEEGGLGGRHDAVLVAVDEERRRRGCIHAHVRWRVFVGLASTQHAVRHRVDQGQEVGPTRLSFHRVFRARIAGVPIRADRRRQMPACGEAHHAEPIRRHAELAGMTAHQSHGALAVEQRDVRVVARADPVAQHERGDAVAVQPAGDLQAFVVGGQNAVAAAGIDDHPGAVRVAFRQVDGELRLIDGLGAERLRGTAIPEGQGAVASQWWSLRRRRGSSARSSMSQRGRRGRSSSQRHPPSSPTASSESPR